MAGEGTPALPARSCSGSRSQALGGLDMVVEQLDRALEALEHQDVELAAMVIADDDRIDGRYLEVHQGILSLLARQAPVAGDLRLVAALLHVIKHVERMGDQCVNIAKLIPLSGHEPPVRDEMLERDRCAWARCARSEVVAGASRRSQRATSTWPRTSCARTARSTASTARSSGCAIEIGDDPDTREWAMHMTLVARALERIGDNAVDIGEVTAFVVTGLFREFSDSSAPTLYSSAGPTRVASRRVGRRWLTVVVVCLASTGAGVTALASLRLDRELSVGTVRIFSDPGHRGALDLYVPLVDWGVRFGGVRVPVRLRVDVQRVDRDAAVSVAREGAGSPRVIARVKRDARDAIASYLRILVVARVRLRAGLRAARRARPARRGPAAACRALIAAGATALALGVAIIVLLAAARRPRHARVLRPRPGHPARAARGRVGRGERQRARPRSSTARSSGLARLVTDAGRAHDRSAGARRSRSPRTCTTTCWRCRRCSASPAGRRCSSSATSPIAARRSRPSSTSGDPARRHAARVRDRQPRLGLRGAGAGRRRRDRAHRARPAAARRALRADGRARRRAARGRLRRPVPPPARARIRRSKAPLPAPSVAEQNLFAEWLAGLEDKVDVVMVHEPALAAKAIEALRRDPPSHPIVLLVGHTHHADIELDRDFTVLNGGTVGAGGTGNLSEGAKIGVARMTYADGRRLRAARRRPRRDRPGQRIGHGEALPARRAARDRSSQIA